MIDGPYREEVLNVVLAQLLQQRGVISAPEQLLHPTAQGLKMPDVLVTLYGLRTIIEGKVDDQPGADQAVWQKAEERVDQGISHIAVAVLYPASLRGGYPFELLGERLADAGLRVAIFSETGPSGWIDGDVDLLVDLLRRTYEQLVKEDIVAEAAQLLDDAVKGFAQTLQGTPADVERAAQSLGIGRASPEELGDGTDDR